MEIFIHLLIFSSFFSSLLLFFKLRSRFRTKTPSTANLPPGPWKLPLIGNLHNLIGSSPPHRALHSLSLKHGPLMHLQLGELSAVIVSSAEAGKQVMKTYDINFASRPSFLAAEIINYGCTGVRFSPYGDYWRQLRKIYTLELLSMKRVQSFRLIREYVCSDIARSIACKEGSMINLSEKLYSSTYGVVTRAAFGKQTKEQETLIVAIIKEVVVLGSGLTIPDLYPTMKFLEIVTGLRHRLKKVRRKLDTICDNIIHEHKVAKADLKKGDEKREEEDLIDVLLKFQDLTADNIKAVIVDVLGAGTETSATSMDWLMAELLKNPRVLAKAQEEVRRVFDEKGYVDESNIDQLKYLKSVINETLRLHPPLPLLLPRKCREKCENINGYEIPVDTRIIVNAWAINRDPQYWENAESFEPERFLHSLVDFKGNCFEYIPFGAGRRMCAGISFALASIELPIATFLYHFDWNLPAGIKHDEMDMTERFGLAVQREKDLYAVPVIKRPLPTN